MNKKKTFSLLTVLLMMFNIMGINKNIWTVTAQDNTEMEISLDEYSEKRSYVEEAIEVDATGDDNHEDTISNLKEVADYVETEAQTAKDELVNLELDNKDELVNLELDNSDDSNLVNRQTSESTDFSYNILGDNTLQIVKYTGSMTDEIIIPQRIDGIIVSEIGDSESPVFAGEANSDIIIEANNITVNKHAFNKLNIGEGSIIFKHNIAEIKEEAFTNLKAKEVIFPEDMLNIPVGTKIFRSAKIRHFTVPYNLKTADTYSVVDYNVFDVVTIKEPLDKSVSYSMGHNRNGDVFFDLVIQEGVTELTNIGLEGVIVDNIYIPSSMEYMSDDVFKEIAEIKNIFFKSVESFDKINLNAILNNTSTSKDINVYVPSGIYQTLPTLDNGEIEEYNAFNFELYGDVLDDNTISPSTNGEYLKMGISFTDSDSVLDRLLIRRENLKQYISDEQPYNVKKIEAKIPKYLIGQDETNKIKLNIVDVKDTTDVTDNISLPYEISEDENSYTITLNDFRGDINFEIRLNVLYNEMIEINELYSGDFVVEGTIVNPATLEERTISLNESINNLEYAEPDLSIETINYHSLTMDNLLSLNNIYDDVLDFDMSGLLMDSPNHDLLNKLKVFYDEGFHNDGAVGESGYAYFDFDFSRYLMEHQGDGIDPALLNNQIKSEGISLLYPDDNDEVILENTGYELIDAADIKADPTQDSKPLKYIVIGDRSIFKNAKKYFSGNHEDLDNFRVIPFDGENLKIKDYASELNVITPLMLFVYGDVEEPPIAVEKININVEKIWDDQENASGDRPSSVEIMLVKDGVDTDIVLTLDDTNNWSASFDNLDKTDNGTEIIYTIKEVNVAEGYTPEISGNVLEGFVVINHKEAINQEPDTPDPEVPTPDKPIVKPDKPDEKPINPSEKPSGPSEKPIIEELKPNIPNTVETPQLEVPNTAVDATYITWFIIMAVSLLLAITNIIKKEKTTY